MESPNLHEWMTYPRFSSFIVHGGILGHRDPRRSPLSFACAKLVRNLERIRSQGNRNVLVIKWFCGEDKDGNPTIAMRVQLGC